MKKGSTKPDSTASKIRALSALSASECAAILGVTAARVHQQRYADKNIEIVRMAKREHMRRKYAEAREAAAIWREQYT